MQFSEIKWSNCVYKVEKFRIQLNNDNNKISIGNPNKSSINKWKKLTFNSLTYHGKRIQYLPCNASQLIFPIPTQTYYISVRAKAGMAPEEAFSSFQQQNGNIYKGSLGNL